MHDLLIIGAGLSGLTAGLAAARAGLSCRVIAKGLGAQLWSPATLDLLGYLSPTSPVTRPLASLDALNQEHPLRRLGSTTIRTAVDRFCQELDDVGLSYSGSSDGEQNVWLPTAVGSQRPTWRAPLSQLAGRLDDDAPFLMVGFAGLRDYFPALAAENLTKQGHTARSVMLPSSLLTDRADSPSPVLARALHDTTRQHALAASLREIVRPGERIGLPALLGIEAHQTVWRTLQDGTGAPVFEVPLLPPSIPGMRLHQALVQKLKRLGVEVSTNMAVETVHCEGDSVRWVASSTSARPLRHQAQNYLLATGGILGGGFESDFMGRCWESLFDLPLSMPQDREKWFQSRFLSQDGHPIFTGGVRVNDRWQPISPTGETIYHNLWAAGNLLAHADTIQTRSRETLAIASATAAVDAVVAARQQAEGRG